MSTTTQPQADRAAALLGLENPGALRVLFVHNRMGAFAGAEANALATAAALRERGHAVGLVHGAPTGQGETEWANEFPRRFSLLGPQARGPGRAVQDALEEFRPNLVYLHKMGDLEVLEALAAAPVPVVTMVHDHELHCMRGYKYHPLTRQICARKASAFCFFPCGAFLVRDRVSRLPFAWVSYSQRKAARKLHQRFARSIVATHYMKGELIKNGFEAGRIEIHAPVPPRGDPGVRASFSPRNRLVYSGQITRGKGVDVLLEALARVSVPFECVVLGDGHYRSTCENLALRLGLQDRVRFEGFVPTARLHDYYREASAGLVSSVWPEPFGAAGLEAMRYGLPVVAFDAGGIREWLEDGVNGFLAPWMDRAVFAARIEQLLRDKDLARRMGGQARAIVADRFNFTKYIDGLESLFAQVSLEGQSRPSNS